MKQIRLFCLVIILGAGASFLIPNFTMANNQTRVSALVLEHLTYKYQDGSYQITTNLDGGYWELHENKKIILVARF